MDTVVATTMFAYLIPGVFDIALCIILNYYYCTVGFLEPFILHYGLPEGAHIALLVSLACITYYLATT